jgi:hypothetical protein
VSAATGQGLFGLLAKVTAKHATLEELPEFAVLCEIMQVALMDIFSGPIARFLVCIKEHKRLLKYIAVYHASLPKAHGWSAGSLWMEVLNTRFTPTPNLHCTTSLLAATHG